MEAAEPIGQAIKLLLRREQTTEQRIYQAICDRLADAADLLIAGDKTLARAILCARDDDL